MATLLWYNATQNNKNNLPTFPSNTYIDTSLATGTNDHWTHIPLVYGGTAANTSDQGYLNGTTSNNLMCRFYSKYGASGSYNLQLVLHINGKVYKGYQGHDTLDAGSNTPSLEIYEENNDNNKNVYITNVSGNAIYSVYATKTNSGYNVTLHKDQQF